MTEAEAIELMTVRGFQEEGEAVGKWRRVLLTSAQLSTYFVGYLELRPHAGRPDPVRRRARARQPAAAAPAGPARGGRRRRGEPRLTARRPTGMRRLAAAIVLAALPLSACSTAAAAAEALDPGGAGSRRVDVVGAGAPRLVSLQRFGGIGGNRDEVTVQPDGSWRRTARVGGATDRQADRGRSRTS